MLFEAVRESNETARSGIQRMLSELADATDDTGARLHGLYRAYASSEDENADAMAAAWTIGDVGAGASRSSDGPVLAREQVSDSPGSELRSPVAQQPMPDPFDRALSLSDFLSPSALILQVWNLVADEDPVEYAVSQIGGDWEKVDKAANALDNISRFCASCALVIRRDLDDIDRHWRGAASDAFQSYSWRFINALEGYADVIDQMASRYHGLSASMWYALRAMSDAITAITDQLIRQLAIEGGAALLTSETLAGPVLTALAASASVAAAISQWAKAASMLGTAKTAAFGTIGFIGGLASNIQEFSLDHPPTAGTCRYIPARRTSLDAPSTGGSVW